MNWYSGDGTDQYIYNEYFQNEKGIMIEVGGGDPSYLSMSKAFREIGWRAISVDPNPEFVKLHKEVNNEIYQYALSEKNEDNVIFYIWEQGPMSYSSLGQRYDKLGNKEIQVNVRTLNWLLEDLKIDHIDLISVDTEGWELEVMKGFDINKYNPKIVILENPYSNVMYHNFMEERGYQMDRKIEVNEIYKLKL